LEKKEKLYCFCAADAFKKHWVKVGPVYTPNEYHNKGYGRAVVGRALDFYREKGFSHAALYAVSKPAIRAYRSLGFICVGAWRQDVLIKPIQEPLNFP